MEKLYKAQSELRDMDDLAAGDSAVHRLHPLCKLLVTILYIAVVVSFGKYDLSGLIVMVLYPALMFQAAEIPVGLCFYRMRLVLPLVCAVGLANPFLDHMPMMQMGELIITGGIVSMVTLMLKGTFSLMASFLLIATTSIDALCAVLRKLRVPGVLVTLLLLTYRYVGLMLEEVAVMNEAYKLRAPGHKGLHISAWGSFLGQLLLRSMDRAEELYSSMLLRGFQGSFYYADVPGCGISSVIYTVLCSALFLAAKFVPVASLLGNMLMR